MYFNVVFLDLNKQTEEVWTKPTFGQGRKADGQ